MPLIQRYLLLGLFWLGMLLTLHAAPAVNVNSATRHVLERGGNASLGVTATGTGALNYQWYRNGSALPGGVSASLLITSATRTDSGWYCVDVTDDTGTTRSKPMFVAVAPAGLRVRTWGDAELSFRPPAALGDVIALKAYNNITMALRRDGTVTGWGTFGNIAVPAGLSDVVAVSAGYARYAAVRSDGSVVEWSEPGSYSRQPPAGLANVVAVGLSNTEAVALRSDGTVVSWGDAWAPPVPTGLSQVTAISVGEMHALALRADGTVVAWGYNYNGQCNVPAGLNSVVAVEAGAYHSLALKADGTVVVWGGNSIEVSTVPEGLTQVIGLVAGHAHSLALKSDGSVVAWGVEEVGELHPPAALAPVHALAAGYRRSLALDDGSTPLIAPAITQSPQSVAVDSTATAVFQSAATGTALTYRWQVKRAFAPDYPWVDLGAGDEGQNFTGGFSPTLTVLNAQYADNGTQYRCVVSNDAGVTTSDAATLTVNVPPPIISTDTKDALVDQNANAFFAVYSVSPVAMTYRWQIKLRGETEWSEHSTAAINAGNPAFGQLMLSATLANHGTQVRCLITNSGGTVTSAVGRLLVKEAITLTPAAAARVSVAPGGTVSLTTTATSALAAPLSYQWKKNNRPIPGATTATCVLADFTAQDAGAYVLEVRDPFGGVARFTRFVVPDFGATQVRGWGANASGQTTPPLTLTNAIAAAAGSAHTVALRANGVLSVFGSNAQGQSPPSGITGDFADVSASGTRSIAVTSAGDYYSWGGGGSARSGGEVAVIAAKTVRDWGVILRNDGTVRTLNWDHSAYPNRNPPTDLSEVAAIAVNEFAAFAVKADGTVVAWTYVNSASAWIEVPAFATDVKAISAGARHVLALKTDGTVVAWGENDSGQTNVPAGLVGVVEIAAGEYTSFARRADGSVVAWGRNTSGEAALPSGLGPVLTLAGGGTHAVALRSAAGDTAPAITAPPVGLLRNTGASATFGVTATGAEPLRYQWRKAGVDIAGATAASYTISPVTSLSYGVYDVVVSNHVGRATSAGALLSVVGEGVPPSVTSAPPSRIIGQPGQPLTFTVTVDSTNLPLSYQWKKNNRQIEGATAATLTLPAFTNDAAGAYTLVITDAAGLKTYVTAFVLPFYQSTQLRHWGGLFAAPASYPVGVDQLVAVAVPLALKADGTVLNLNNTSSPSALGAAPANATNVVAIRTGSWALALRADGTPVVWNSFYSPPPAPPADAVNLIDASVGSGHALALRSDGRVVAWGANFHGQISVPAGLTDVVQVAAGGIHSLALKADGTVVAWGNNGSGQSTVPAGLTDVAAVAAGYATSFALKRDGSIVAWGVDDLSQQITVPAAAVPASAVFAGPYHTVALKPDGTIASWGSNGYGQQAVPADLTNVVQASLTGEYTMVLRDASNDAPPTITQQPVAALIAIDNAFTLSVQATGVGPFSYQWRRSGNPIAGETSATFTRASAQTGDAGSYDVIVSNHRGGVTSNAVTVALDQPPLITSAPAGITTFAPGTALSLQITASSANIPLTYVWRKNNRVIAGATSTQFSKADATASDAGVYTVEITDAAGLKTWGLYFVQANFTRTQVLGWGGEVDREKTLSTSPVVQVAWPYGVTRDGGVIALGSDPAGTFSPVGMTQVVKLVRGFALKSDGTVVQWPNYPNTFFAPPAGLRNVVDIGLGYDYAIALRADGCVVVWGSASFGMSTVPDGVHDVVEMAPGYRHATVLRADGEIVTWGTLLGDSATFPTSEQLAGSISVVAGEVFSAALTSDGGVRSWGFFDVDWAAQTPRIAKLAAGADHLLALTDSGAVRSVGGSNDYGQLNVPSAAVGVAAIFATDDTSFAIRDSSGDSAPMIATQPLSRNTTVGQSATFTVQAAGRGPFSYQWRRNGAPIANATDASLVVPVTEAGLTDGYDVIITNHIGSVTSATAILTTRPLVQVAREGAGRRVLLPGEGTTLSVAAAGTGALTYQWFHNGRPLFGATAATLELTTVTMAANGYYYADVSDDFGTRRSSAHFVVVAPASTRVVSFGLNYAGQNLAPSDLTDAVAISAGWSHSLAIKRDGTVCQWGAFSPLPADLTDVVAISASPYYSLALKSDGTVVALGGNVTLPAELTEVVAISAGQDAAVALRNDGTVIGWNVPAYGRVVPPPPPGLKGTGVPAIGSNHAAVIKPDGTVAVWGSSTYGQTNLPVGLTDVVKLEAGGGHTLALTTSGAVVAWGYNLAGQINVPEGLPRVTAVAAGGSHSMALRDDGTVVAWGGNTYGETSVPNGLRDVIAIAAGSSHSLALREWVSDAPLITGHPSARYVFVPGAATFAVSASGGVSLSYRWQRLAAGAGKWVDLAETGPYSGTTTNTLRVGSTTLAMSGDLFRCVVANSVGSVTSEAGLLGTMRSTTNTPGVSLSLGSQRRVGQTLGITLRVGDSDHDLLFASLWIRTPAGNWLTLKRDGSSTAGQEFSENSAITTAEEWLSTSFVFTAEHGAGVYTIAAAAVDAAGQRSDASQEITVEPNRPPTAAFYLSGHHTVGETVEISLQIDDLDGNYAYSNLRVHTPKRGWLTVRGDNTIALSGDLSAANNSSTHTGYQGLRFPLTATDGAGTYTFAFAVVDSLGLRTDAIDKTVTVVAPMTRREAWWTAFFTAAERENESISGPNADPDGDGFVNLLEYALGLAPTSADTGATASLPEVTATATEWTYTYTRPDDRSDVTYAVEVSTNLAAWTTTGVTHELVSTDAGAGTQTWRARYPLSSAANAFFRLKVALP